MDLGYSLIEDLDSLTIGMYLSEANFNAKVINLSQNKLTDHGLLNMLIGIQFHSNLQELYLNNNPFKIGSAIEGLSVILPCLKNLRILGLGNEYLSKDNSIESVHKYMFTIHRTKNIAK